MEIPPKPSRGERSTGASGIRHSLSAAKCLLSRALPGREGREEDESSNRGGTGGRESTCIECSRHFFATSCRALHAHTHTHMQHTHTQLITRSFQLSLCITCDSYVDRDESTFGSKTAGRLLRVRQIPRERCARLVSLFSPLSPDARALRYLSLSLSFSRFGMPSLSFTQRRSPSLCTLLTYRHSHVKGTQYTGIHVYTSRRSNFLFHLAYTPPSLLILSFSLFRP